MLWVQWPTRLISPRQQPIRVSRSAKSTIPQRCFLIMAALAKALKIAQLKRMAPGFPGDDVIHPLSRGIAPWPLANLVPLKDFAPGVFPSLRPIELFGQRGFLKNRNAPDDSPFGQ